MSETQEKSCVNCGALSCMKNDGQYPDFCLTTSLEQDDLDDMVQIYKNDPLVSLVAKGSAQVEGAFYGKYTRVEEIMAFAKRIEAKKIGIATCVGLINESRTFARILKFNGFEVYGIACKVGAVEKKDIGVEPQYILKEGENMCNPVLQAKLLATKKTDLNVVVGLCVGHDSLFYKYSETIATTLVTKDRVLGHNPIACLYLTGSYYAKLLSTKTV